MEKKKLIKELKRRERRDDRNVLFLGIYCFAALVCFFSAILIFKDFLITQVMNTAAYFTLLFYVCYLGLKMLDIREDNFFKNELRNK